MFNKYKSTLAHFRNLLAKKKDILYLPVNDFSLYLLKILYKYKALDYYYQKGNFYFFQIKHYHSLPILNSIKIYRTYKLSINCKSMKYIKRNIIYIVHTKYGILTHRECIRLNTGGVFICSFELL